MTEYGTDWQRKLVEAREYLETGGLGETLGLAYMARDMGEPKVQMDTGMAVALCLMASEAVGSISRGNGGGGKPS